MRYPVLRPLEDLAVVDVEDVVPTGLAGVADGWLAVVVDDMRRAGSVEVPDVVGQVLVAPLHLAVGHLNSADRLRPAVVARADQAIEVGRWVPDRDKDEAPPRIERRRHPDGTSATRPRVGVLILVGFLFPGVAVQALVATASSVPVVTPPATFLG